MNSMPSVFAAPGEKKIYKYYARAEGPFLLHSLNDNQNGQLAGLFGAVRRSAEGRNRMGHNQ